MSTYDIVRDLICHDGTTVLVIFYSAGGICISHHGSRHFQRWLLVSLNGGERLMWLVLYCGGIARWRWL